MKTKMYEREINGIRFFVLELPNTNIFKYEVRYLTGSLDIEKEFLKRHGKKIYGGLHLLEHMSFKSPRDFTTKELLNLSKKNGIRNATTSFNDINFFFKTTMDNVDLGLRLVNNVAFNDLSRVKEEEFKKERGVVVNEINRYHEDKQMIFQFSMYALAANRKEYDNILGTADIVNKIELEDLVKLKNILTEYEPIAIVLFDPTKYEGDFIYDKVYYSIKDFMEPKEEYKTITPIEFKNDRILSTIETNQNMFAMVFDICDNSVIEFMGNSYIRELAGEYSIFNLYREKHGITYGAKFYNDRLMDKERTFFVVDTKKEDAELSKKLILDILVKLPDLYTDEVHEEVKKSTKLKQTLSLINLENYESELRELIYKKHMINYDYFVNIHKDLFTAIELDFNSIKREDVLDYLNRFKDAIENKKMKIITNTKELLED